MSETEQNNLEKSVQEFKSLVSQVKFLVDKMKAEPLRRVYKAAAEFPFNETTPNFIRKDEHQLFVLLAALSEHKRLLQNHLGMSADFFSKVQEQAAAEFASEIISNSTTKEGEQNGKVD